MNKELMNKIITGFQFNVAWLVSVSNLIVMLDNPAEMAKLKQDSPNNYLELVKPVYMLLSDCVEIAKSQDIDLSDLGVQD